MTISDLAEKFRQSKKRVDYDRCFSAYKMEELSVSDMTILIEATAYYRSAVLPTTFGYRFAPEHWTTWEAVADNDRLLTTLTKLRRDKAKGAMPPDQVKQQMRFGLTEWGIPAPDAEARAQQYADAIERWSRTDNHPRSSLLIPFPIWYTDGSSPGNYEVAHIAPVIIDIAEGTGQVTSPDNGVDGAIVRSILREKLNVDPNKLDVAVYQIDYTGGYMESRQEEGIAGKSYLLCIVVGLMYWKDRIKDAVDARYITGWPSEPIEVPILCTGSVTNGAIGDVLHLDTKLTAFWYSRLPNIMVPCTTYPYAVDLANARPGAHSFWPGKEEVHKRILTVHTIEDCLEHLSAIMRQSEDLIAPVQVEFGLDASLREVCRCPAWKDGFEVYLRDKKLTAYDPHNGELMPLYVKLTEGKYRLQIRFPKWKGERLTNTFYIGSQRAKYKLTFRDGSFRCHRTV